jgi:hypothetical protein
VAISVYPKKVILLWENFNKNSSAYFKNILHTFDYHPKAVSVSAEDPGMEYPMICWDYGRPDEKG